MNKPTPGPWGFRYRFNPGDREHDQLDAYAITANNGETTIAETLFSCKDDEANAQLLAAAPDLLEALEKVHTLRVCWPKEVEKSVNAAIAKARGKQ